MPIMLAASLVEKMAEMMARMMAEMMVRLKDCLSAEMKDCLSALCWAKQMGYMKGMMSELMSVAVSIQIEAKVFQPLPLEGLHILLKEGESKETSW